MVNYHHGITIRDGETVSPIVANATNIIGLIGVAGKGPINEATLITSYKQGLETFGAWADDGFSIVRDLKDIFNQANARVIVVNVKTRDEGDYSLYEEAQVTFNKSNVATLPGKYILENTVEVSANLSAFSSFAPNETITLPSGASFAGLTDPDTDAAYVIDVDYSYDSEARIITRISDGAIDYLGEVIVSYVASPALDTDYSINYETGVLTRIPGGVLLPKARVTVNFMYLNSSYEDSTVIGAEVEGDVRDNTGVYQLLAAPSVLGLTPKLLTCGDCAGANLPDEGANTVLTALLGVAERLGAIVISSTPTDYEDAVAFRDLHDDKRLFLVQTKSTIEFPDDTSTQNLAAMVAAAFAKSDTVNTNGVASVPSGTKLNGITRLRNPVEYSLTRSGTLADTLNELGMAVVVNNNGYRLSGVRAATDDSTYKFINVIRVSDFIKDAIASSHFEFVDKNISGDYTQALVQRVNNFLRDLVAKGTIIYGKCFLNPTLNTGDAKLNGEVYIDYEIGVPGIAEHIIFTANIVNGYVASVQEAN